VNAVLTLVERDESDYAAAVVALRRRGGDFDRVAEVLFRAMPSVLAAADVDGDQIVDLITGNDAAVSVSYGRGDGSFLEELALATETPVSAVGVADIDSDGSHDVVYSSAAEDEVSLFWGDGGRRLAAGQLLATGGMITVDLTSPDVDDDGAPDLAALNRSSDDVSILRNAGHGDFAEPIVVATPPQLLAMALGRLTRIAFLIS
jgi:hypothetical protein